jgi:crotonobetainyl-CoA:carnitine CoA-transferase CaiB-like acyl-CoA transferase
MPTEVLMTFWMVARARSVPQVASPALLDGERAIAGRAPPLLGEHTQAVLRDRLHLTDSRIRELADAGVVQLR